MRLRREARPRPRGRRIGVLLTALMAAVIALSGEVAQVLGSAEQDTVSLRFQLRGEQEADGVAVVAIDDVTFSDLDDRRWPYPRSWHAQAIDALRKAGAKRIVYDVQFTEQTRRREDFALYDALVRAPGTVLATTETDGSGATRILGGDDNLAAAGAHAGAANLVTDPRDVIHRFPYSSGGLASLSVVVAREEGKPLEPSDFEPGGAWIDFRGPAGTIPTVSFSDLLAGRADTSPLRGRIVVVGASAPTLQDVHATPTSRDRLMSGPEIQANAIWTALHGLPLRRAPRWVGWLAILALALLPALATLRGRAARAAVVAPLLGAGYLLIAQGAFASGTIVPVTYPLAALLLGTLGAIVTAYVAEREERRRVGLYSERLEDEVRARTEELRETQVEIVRRLGRAIDWRDAATGVHVDRMSTLAHRLALAAGMDAEEAELLRQAAALHDVGKVGIPDAILGKPGALDPDERAVMETHTGIGAAILAGSRSALVQLAERIARSHHERWDGSGYPDGLSGDAIPLAARICAVCDVFDALISRRPYKEAWSVPDALTEIAAQRGRQFDPALVDAFLALVPELEPAVLGAVAPPEQGRLGVATVVASDDRRDAPVAPPVRRSV